MVNEVLNAGLLVKTSHKSSFVVHDQITKAAIGHKYGLSCTSLLKQVFKSLSHVIRLQRCIELRYWTQSNASTNSSNMWIFLSPKSIPLAFKFFSSLSSSFKGDIYLIIFIFPIFLTLSLRTGHQPFITIFKQCP